MYSPVFSLNLNRKVLSGRVAIGEFDGKNASLVGATMAEKVFVHNPRNFVGSASGRMEASGSNREVSILNINQRVTSLTAGRLDPNQDKDCLLVGTPTNLLAYDIEQNADIFYKDVPDGTNVVIIGTLDGGENPNTPMAIVGGNCSLQGFDAKGNDPFWTVTGDNVTALALMDYNNNGKNELIVGSEDYEIRVFSYDEILTEITETEAVKALIPIQNGRFGYALSNGTVGVYEKTTRWWRIKSKNSAAAIFSFDLDGDGVKELITGWSNGKLDARNDRSGEVVFKDNFNHAIAGLVEGDYKNDGKMELIACSNEGEVRGYLPQSLENQKTVFDFGTEQETIRELSQRKNSLLLELRNYEENQRFHNSSTGSTSLSTSILARQFSKSSGIQPQMTEASIIPAQTQLSTALAINLGTEGKPPHVEITLSTSNETIIKCVLIFAEGIFEGESHVVHLKEPTSTVHIPIFPKDIPVDLHIKAFVGYKNSRHFHVFELTRQLPRFSMYCRLTEPSPNPDPVGWVKFNVKERTARVALWLNQNFLMGEELEPNDDKIDVTFTSLRKQNMDIRIKVDETGNFEIKCDNMELCGDLIQNLVEYLAYSDLPSKCDFPEEIESLEGLLQSADELQGVRQRLSAEMADHSGIIRTLVVRAEDSRLMNDMKSMRKWYSQLNDINKDLISGYKIRCNNHQELMETLKTVNQIIQKAGRLRAGKSKAKVVTDCRNAIKDNNSDLLIRVIRTGGDSV